MTAAGHGMARVKDGIPCTDAPRGGPCRRCSQAIQIINRAAVLAADPTAAKHGTVNTYINWLCRCDECAAAMAQKNRRRSRKPWGPRTPRRPAQPFGREWLNQ